MTARSMDQLRHTTWPSREAAIKELKRNGFQEQGEDYVLGETSPGSAIWHLRDRTDETAPPKNDVAGKKPSVVARIKAAKPAKQEQADNVITLPSNGSAEPQNDMSALPANGGPYSLQAADQLAQHSIVEDALRWSQMTGERIAIVAAGRTVRVIDGRIGSKGRVERRKREPKPSGQESKRSRCATLLLRPKGATASELAEVLGRSASLTFINKLAELNDAGVEVLGDKHWKLVKKS